MLIAMIPARMGSQRLKKKNMRELNGVPLITHAIRKCKEANIFDEIWVNSEHPDFGDIAKKEGVQFHLRPEQLGNNQATSEQYLTEFLEKHTCKYVVQVHSIAPLLSVADILQFVNTLQRDDYDSLLGVELVQIECAFQDKPVNFSVLEKTNSQDLEPLQRLSWCISAWNRSVYMDSAADGKCATYSGRVGYHPVNQLANFVIKTEHDLAIAEALLPLVLSD